MADLLEALWSASDAGEASTWLAQHVPGGDLAAIWAASTSPQAVYALGGIGIDRATLVRALLAAAELVADRMPADAPHSRACLAAAARWVAGDADLAEVTRAFDGGNEEHAQATSRPELAASLDAMCAAIMPAAVILAKPARRPPMRAAQGLSCIEAIVGGAALAATLRAVLPCPSIAALTGAT